MSSLSRQLAQQQAQQSSNSLLQQNINNLSKIPGLKGYAVIDMTGNVIQVFLKFFLTCRIIDFQKSNGELENQSDTINNIYHMIQDVKGILPPKEKFVKMQSFVFINLFQILQLKIL